MKVTNLLALYMQKSVLLAGYVLWPGGHAQKKGAKRALLPGIPNVFRCRAKVPQL
jgi:hypothetical protein